MMIRLAKILLVAAVGFYLALVVFNNLTDYGSNYVFIQHVLAMDTTFPGNAGMWRALHSVWLIRFFYLSIIVWEVSACALALSGAWRLWGARSGSAAAFNRTKTLAIAGLTLNLLQWLVAFIAIGGEWFLMWQSSSWNGNEAAARMFLIVGVTLLFVSARDEEL
jgi:predicted small integral membrane protein